MNTLLVITTGQTDVQLVINGQRRKLEGNRCGELHDAIMKSDWTVVDSPTHRGCDFVKELPPGRPELCTPKLDAVLAHLAPARPTSVLILETARQDPRDPRHAGAILERRLRDLGVAHVTRSAFLIKDEQLEDPGNEMDAVVRRAVVASLADAIRQATKNLAQDDHVFVATTGGLAAANELINELVRLHCVDGPQVTALEVPDRARVEGADQAVPEKFHPAAEYRTRWHALSLIGKGNFLGARGAVSHLEGEPGQEWTQVVEWLALFASSLPLPDACDLRVLGHARMAVRAALRVELALRAGDIPRAIHGTVAFFESALWDSLLERFERSSDPGRRRHYKVKKGAAPTGEKLLRQGGNNNDDRKRPFELKDAVDGVQWYWIHDGDGGPAARLARHFLNNEPLTAFDKALGHGIRTLRNDIAHNEPTPEFMRDARSKMRSAGLWSETDTFLGQKIVCDVLETLGEKQPRTLLADLLCEVRDRLLAPPICPDPQSADATHRDPA